MYSVLQPGPLLRVDMDMLLKCREERVYVMWKPKVWSSTPQSHTVSFMSWEDLSLLKPQSN